MAVHFVGFRSDEFWSAVKVWGYPDFVHMWRDRRMEGDLAPGDVVVYGPKGSDKVSKWTWQDHNNW